MKTIEQNGFIFEMESYKKLASENGYGTARFKEILSSEVKQNISPIEFRKNNINNHLTFSDFILDVIIEIEQKGEKYVLTLRNTNLNITFRISLPNEHEAIKFANHIMSFKINSLMQHLNKYIIQ